MFQSLHRRHSLLRQSPALNGYPVATDALVDGDLLVYDAATLEWLSTQTLTAKLTGVATTTTQASFNAPHGTAPTSPVDGDIWTTTAGLYVRINGSTVGPLS